MGIQVKVPVTMLACATSIALLSVAFDLWLKQAGSLGASEWLEYIYTSGSSSIAAYSSSNRNLGGISSRNGSFPANLPPGTSMNRRINNSVPVMFTLHQNGDGTGEGISINSTLYKDVDQIIVKYCCELANVTSTPERCAPGSGARLVGDSGVRVLSFADLEPNQRVYCVVQGVHFVWPLVKVGNMIWPKNVVGPIPGHPIVLKQLSNQPRVFSVSNFVAPAEVEELLRVNKDRLTPSEVGFGGWQDDTRTSSTSWDFNSPAAIAIQKRTFEILGMDYIPEIADAMQVLRYTSDGGNKIKGQWYKPHVDWFNSDGYDGNDPMVNNGTNRFATMFLYLSDVEEGGATVFPLSTSHEGYNGERIVHDGTEKTPGYINTQEALAACNATSTALKSYPRQSNAVLFYSQGPEGMLDRWSLHGGCPPIRGLKWSANVWIWNRQRPDKSKAKDMPKAKMKNAGGFSLQFRNGMKNNLDVLWDSNSLDPTIDSEDVHAAVQMDSKRERFKLQFEINAGFVRQLETFDKHVFVFVDKVTNKVVFRHRAAPPKEALDVEGDVIVVE